MRPGPRRGPRSDGRTYRSVGQLRFDVVEEAVGGCRLGAGSGCRYQEGTSSVPCGLLDGAPARFVPGRRSSCDCSGFASGATGSREFSLVALAGLGRPSLATWRRRLRGRFTRRVPGRVPGPLRSAGTGRFVGAPHSAPVRRWPSRRDAGWRTARRPRRPRCVRTVRCARREDRSVRRRSGALPSMRAGSA